MHAESMDRSMAEPSRQAPRRAWLVALLLWIGSFVVLTLAHAAGVVPTGLGYTAAASNAVLGGAAVWTYLRLLRRMDELERKIQVEALALGFGAGAVGMTAYRLFERAGAPPVDVNDALLVMLLGYVAGVVTARRRYA
jgi:hypothetical protein